MNGDGTLTTGTLTYTLSDHLGSTTREVGSTGTLSSAVKYWPFGAARDYTTPPERGYTGQQQETTNSTGMYYYHARFYSTAMGRFVSPDPTGGSGTIRFAYAEYNPVSNTDPSGYETCGLLDACATPAPEAAPTIPPPTPEEMCAGDLAACIFWSVGGDWVAYINLVASHYGIDAEILAAIMLWEMAHYDEEDASRDKDLQRAVDWSYDWIVEILPVWGKDLPSISVGPAQIQLRNARKLEDEGRVPQVDDSTSVRRLRDPVWSVMYAAALMASFKENHIPGSRQNNAADYIVLWRTDPDNYESWRSEPLYAPNTNNIVREYDIYRNGNAVPQLAVKLSEW